MECREHERIDDLQRNGYRIIQNRDRFCFGMDAVLLAGFARVKPGEQVLDLGTGTGIIPILLEARYEGEHYTGLEIQADMADMAARSVALNGLEHKITIIEGDIKEAGEKLGLARFDVVTCNPPYMNDAHGLKRRPRLGGCGAGGTRRAAPRGVHPPRPSAPGRPFLYGPQAPSSHRDHHCSDSA